MTVQLPATPRILLVMMSAVGDTVHALPVVTALRRARPGAHITWILQPGPASLVRGHPDVDEIIEFPRRRGWRAFLDVRRALAGREFDIVIDLQVYLKASVVTAIADAPVKLGFDRARARDLNWLVTTHRIPAGPPRHVQDQYFEFLDELGVPHEPVEWKMGPWPRERAAQRDLMARFDAPVVPLVVGSSDRSREWSPDRWARLHDALIDDFGLRPVIAGGRSAREIETEAEIRRIARRDVVSTLGISLRELVALLDGSALTISLNTAPLHISVAVGTPVITLASALNPRRTGPYRHYHDLIVDAYGHPGEAYPISNEKRTSRMSEITVDAVLEKVDRWRTRYGLAGDVRGREEGIDASGGAEPARDGDGDPRRR